MPETFVAKLTKGKDTARSQEHPAEFAGQFAPTSPGAAVLALQRSAGNQASNHLLGQGFRTSPSTGGLLQRKCACGNNTTAGGECEECGQKHRLSLQTKLTVNEPGDIYEQEADRIADQVTAMPTHHTVSNAPQLVHDVLRAPGRPLHPETRAFMEARFGHDFSRVRVHTDEEAN